MQLQALAGADGGTSDREEQARRAQERLHATAPWDLLHAAAALDPEILTPAAREAQQSCQRLSLQLGSASEERLLQAFLPASAVPTFTAADNTSEAAKQQQEDALMQVSNLRSCTSRCHLERAVTASDLTAVTASLHIHLGRSHGADKTQTMAQAVATGQAGYAVHAGAYFDACALMYRLF